MSELMQHAARREATGLANSEPMRPVISSRRGDGVLSRLRWPPLSGGPAKVLVVLCHGVAASARKVADLATAWRASVPEAAFSAPDAPFPYRTRILGRLDPWGLRGREWFSLIDRSPQAEESGVRTASALLDRFIDVELQRLGLPSEAVVLAGFSQGAMMALYTGLRRPAAPRGIIGFSGALPGLQHIPQEMRNRAPVLLVHGEADPIVPAERSRDAENALRALEIPVRLVPVPGLGHAIDSSGMQAGLDFLRGVLA